MNKIIGNRKLYKIPCIAEVIANYLSTDEGKQAVLDYINEQDAWNYELINEIKNYTKDDTRNNKYRS
jgi:hypothetical protein